MEAVVINRALFYSAGRASIFVGGVEVVVVRNSLGLLTAK